MTIKCVICEKRKSKENTITSVSSAVPFNLTLYAPIIQNEIHARFSQIFPSAGNMATEIKETMQRN